ncbi:MAG TPA: hypothetical protein V6C86_10880 [Oculatellaceae cyanobacterium]
MFETILKGLSGRWGMLALVLALTPTGRKLTKTAVKELVRAGVTASEKIKELTDEIKEEGYEIIAEIKEERNAEENGAAKGSNSKKEAST